MQSATSTNLSAPAPQHRDLNAQLKQLSLETPQQKQQPAAFATHKVTLVGSDKGSADPKAYLCTGIKPDQSLQCLNFQPTKEGGSLRISDLTRVTLPKELFPTIRSYEATANGFAYTAPVIPKRSQLINLEYRLVADRKQIEQKLVTAASRAKAQQQEHDLQLQGGNHGYYGLFQREMSEFLSCMTISRPRPNDEDPVSYSANVPGFHSSGFCWTPGGNVYQEDRVLFTQGTDAAGENYILYGVYDGHGGYYCSQRTLEILPEKYKQRLDQFSGVMTPDVARWNAAKLAHVDTALTLRNNKVAQHCGTTACTLMVHGNTMTFANTGDSRGIIVKDNGEIIQATEDAIPAIPHYESSINKRQGVIKPLPGGDYPRVGGNLGPARSLGDGELAGITARPKITRFEIEKGQTVILTTDGISDVATSTQIGQIVHRLRKQQCYTADHIADVLVKLAFTTYQAYRDYFPQDENRLADNMTALVIFTDRFNPREESSPAPSVDKEPSADMTPSAAKELTTKDKT